MEDVISMFFFEKNNLLDHVLNTVETLETYFNDFQSFSSYGMFFMS